MRVDMIGGRKEGEREREREKRLKWFTSAESHNSIYLANDVTSENFQFSERESFEGGAVVAAT